MIKGIAHVAYTVADMEKSLWFYCEVLGFPKAFELKDEDGNPWIIYIKVAEGQFIELFYNTGKSVAEKPKEIGYSHLCLEVEDINGIAKIVKDHGLTLDVEPVQGMDLNYQCWVKDPDGNRIEFMQMHRDSLQNNCK